MDFTTWHGGGMWIFWIAVAIAVGLFIVWLNRRGERRGSWMTRRERLEDRFGRGEIGGREYEAGLREIEEDDEETPRRSGDRGTGAAAIFALLLLTATSSAATEPAPARNLAPMATPTWSTAWDDPLYPGSHDGASLVSLPIRSSVELGDALEQRLALRRETVPDRALDWTDPSSDEPLLLRLSTLLEALRSRSEDRGASSVAVETGPARLFTCVALGRGWGPR